MSLKLKEGVMLDQLRELGFAPGKELAAQSKYAPFFYGCEYMLPWWHKFAEDENGEVITGEDELPLVHAWVKPIEGEVWFDVTPCYTYHAEMEDLDLVTDTIFAMAMAGVLEKKEDHA